MLSSCLLLPVLCGQTCTQVQSLVLALFGARASASPAVPQASSGNDAVGGGNEFRWLHVALELLDTAPTLTGRQADAIVQLVQRVRTQHTK